MKSVESADGTLVAYEQGGKGPDLVLVHGMGASRARWTSIRPRFEEHFAVTTMDRRGRGDSGDSPEYSIEREFEDVAAVVDAVQAPVLLFGHSSGGIFALEAAMRTDQVAGLVLYEPSTFEGKIEYPSEQIERLETLLAGGDRDGAVKAFMADIVGMSSQELENLTTSPAWAGRVAAAHTLPRELRAEEAYRLPADRVGKLSIPVLLLRGGDSPLFFAEAIAALECTLPNSRTVVMPGQKHIAMDTGPDLLVSTVLDFWRDIN